MRRGLGFAAGAAVLVAGLSLIPTARGPELQVAPTATLPSHPKPAGRSEKDKSLCPAFADSRKRGAPDEQGEIAQRVQRFLYGKTFAYKLAPKLLPPGIRYVIATVPDPEHTHLSLMFDRMIEALQESAQDESYTYDSSWLPWKTESALYQLRKDQKDQETEDAERERCPGLMLFRKSLGVKNEATPPLVQFYNEGLFIFLVGETPTQGINRVQFDNALWWIASHANETTESAHTLKILGPTFSGSAPSIVRAIRERGRQSRAFFGQTQLYTGTLSDCHTSEWLRNIAGASPLEFASFAENDTSQIKKFLTFIQNQGFEVSDSAILSEDETAYGSLETSASATSPSSQCELIADFSHDRREHPVNLYYPRDISALRSAYEEQSIFATASRQTSGAQRTILRSDLEAAPKNGFDTVPTFSARGLALAEEAQLYGVVDALLAHHIQYVILRSTNTLDYLFLARFLHRAYPAGRIVTMGPDMLFRREIDSTEFRGVLALSDYPLLPRGQDWTLQNKEIKEHAHRIFATQGVEGMYIASRYLIQTPFTEPQLALPFHPNIPDYRHPFWEDSPSQSAVPSTWLSVVGRNGYWPVALLDKTETAHHETPSSLTNASRTPDTDGNPNPYFSFPPAWFMLCGLSLLFLSFHFFATNRGWKIADFGGLIHFSPVGSKRHACIVAIEWTIVVLVLATIYSAAFILLPFRKPLDESKCIQELMLIAVIAGVGFAWYDMYGQMRGEDDAPFPKSWWLIPISMLALFCLIFHSERASFSDVSTAYRNIHPSSGVSPVLPIILLLLGFYWWTWQTKAGAALMGRGRPLLPDIVQGSILVRVGQSMAQEIEVFAMPLPRDPYLYFVPLLAVVLFWIYTDHFSGFAINHLEARDYGWLLHGMLTAALVLVILDLERLLMTWMSLKRLLLALDHFPLRRTFSALRKLPMRSLWTMSGTSSRSRYTVFSHQLESLSHLNNSLRNCGSEDAEIDDLRETVKYTLGCAEAFAVARCKDSDYAMVNTRAARKIRIAIAKCAEQLLIRLLLPEWRKETVSQDFQFATASSAPEPRARATVKIKERVQLAEEFVCLVYVAYLQNMLGCMRTMALAILGVFVAVSLALAFYPFTPRPAISWYLLVALILIGSIVTSVYAGLERDATLSNITDTTPGHLGGDFYLRLLSFVGAPLLGLLLARFPELTDFFSSWIEPSMSSK